MLPFEQKLPDVLSEFARTMATNFPILDHLVRRIVDMLPITAAGVTIISEDYQPRYLSASDESAFGYEQLQAQLGEGPCLLAHESGEAVLIPDLAKERRFPRYTAHAWSAGVAAVFSFPLRHGAQQLGALDLYHNAAGELSDDALRAAQTLADIAAAYLLNAQTREELRDAWRRTREESLHDGLTGLPNRELLVGRLESAFQRSRRSGKTVAVLFMDLDRLKAVNDTYGHRTGDQLLVAVGKRLAGLVRPGDTRSRLSGDEFVVVCEDLDDPAQAAIIGNRLLGALGSPFHLGSVDNDVTASIGLAYAEHGEYTPEHMLHEADVAMYQAKREGGDRHQVFSERLQHLVAPATGMERDLHLAIERDELRNEYQPIVATEDGGMTGFEALVRWSHPLRGEVPPVRLIPLAEKSDLINDIGGWVLSRAWHDRKPWRGHDGVTDLAIAVNVSAHQIMSKGFADVVAEVLNGSDASPDLLTLEITESVFLRDSEYALPSLGRLRDLGVKLALDDFGTGFSSLNYFKRFPVDIIKIDQSFVVVLNRSPTSKAIAGAVVGLAHGLGMTVIAEPVETAEQHEAVTRLGCDSSQGFYFGRPMSSLAIDGLLNHHVRERVGACELVPTPRVPDPYEGDRLVR
ncbi:diguanylate cyclase (GGDEF)-like protein [Nakamurella sp. UYEF19]|uniref:putative bifunctional diguanylate cyclase/phosphodiesterase n=1 Tax=Nakamurella sp. UYEF19 TaxID=1756392 RepID=UPI003399F676